MTTDKPSPVPEIYADIGKMEGFRQCSEILLDLIPNEVIVTTVKDRLIEAKCETRKRREHFHNDKIVNEGWTEEQVDKNISGEKAAIQTIIDLIGD